MSEQSTFLWAEPPVKASASPDSAAEWMTLVAGWRGSFLELLGSHGPAGWHGRTSPDARQRRTGETLELSSGRWQGSGMVSPGESLTLNLSESTAILGPSPSDGGVCSLSDILETGDHLSRYCLSPKACAGILRRAEKRGKVLPEALRSRLWRQVADSEPTSTATLGVIAETLRSHPRPGSNTAGSVIPVDLRQTSRGEKITNNRGKR